MALSLICPFGSPAIYLQDEIGEFVGKNYNIQVVEDSGEVFHSPEISDLPVEIPNSKAFLPPYLFVIGYIHHRFENARNTTIVFRGNENNFVSAIITSSSTFS